MFTYPFKENPMLVNPFKTFNHEKAIEIISSMMNMSTEKLIEEKKRLELITNYIGGLLQKDPYLQRGPQDEDTKLRLNLIEYILQTRITQSK